jgi:DNA adenine methylase
VTSALKAQSVPPLVKWTGSKRSQAAAIVALFPRHRRYFEPFLGGGSLLYLAARPGATAGDLYEPLVSIFRLVQESPSLVARRYAEDWHSLRESGPDHFYRVRARFNETRDPLALNFLLRTCVNGIVRFNSAGAFNNSFHLSRPGMDPARFAKIVAAWSAKLEGVTLVCGDYETTLETAERGDLAYLDPPYAGNRQRYSRDLDLERFFSVLERLSGRGVRWLLSFDGRRGGRDLAGAGVPRELWRRRLLVPSGHSAVGKVLNGRVEDVKESLYLNF